MDLFPGLKTINNQTGKLINQDIYSSAVAGVLNLRDILANDIGDITDFEKFFG